MSEEQVTDIRLLIQELNGSWIGEFCTSTVLPSCHLLFLPLLILPHIIPLLSRKIPGQFVEKE